MALSSEEDSSNEKLLQKGDRLTWDTPATPYKWSTEMTKRFVKLRTQYGHLFTGKRNTARAGMQLILTELGLDEVVTEEQAKRKWENMYHKYKELKSGAVNGKPCRQWVFYKHMDACLGSGDGEGDASSEDDVKERLPPVPVQQGVKRKTVDVDSEILALLKEGNREMKLARQRYEEQSAEMLGLLRRLVDDMGGRGMDVPSMDGLAQ